jgi:hypothetical protein
MKRHREDCEPDECPGSVPVLSAEEMVYLSELERRRVEEEAAQKAQAARDAAAFREACAVRVGGVSLASVRFNTESRVSKRVAVRVQKKR